MHLALCERLDIHSEQNKLCPCEIHYLDLEQHRTNLDLVRGIAVESLISGR